MTDFTRCEKSDTDASRIYLSPVFATTEASGLVGTRRNPEICAWLCTPIRIVLNCMRVTCSGSYVSSAGNIEPSRPTPDIHSSFGLFNYALSVDLCPRLGLPAPKIRCSLLALTLLGFWVVQFSPRVSNLRSNDRATSKPGSCGPTIVAIENRLPVRRASPDSSRRRRYVPI